MGTSKPPGGAHGHVLREAATGTHGTAEPAAARNPGVALDLAWLRAAHVDTPEVERRAAALAQEPKPEGPRLARALLEAVGLLDLTTLAGDDTPARVERLAGEARNPLPRALLEAHGVADPGGVRVAAVCVYHRFIETAGRALEGSGIPVAAVSAGFPHGLSPLETRLAEIEASVRAGAGEIDAVIARFHALTGDWRSLYDEVRAFRAACGPALLKVILATGELGSLEDVARASLVAAMAGADFVKTSTGKERVNATLPVGVTIARALRDYAERTGWRVGLKAAGGIRTPEQALDWTALVARELGEPWHAPRTFRIGASGLLSEVVRRLEHLAPEGPRAGGGGHV